MFFKYLSNITTEKNFHTIVCRALIIKRKHNFTTPRVSIPGFKFELSLSAIIIRKISAISGIELYFTVLLKVSTIKYKDARVGTKK